MTAGSAPLRGVAPETLLAALRVALGLTFVIGGIKIAFPPDATALATSYIDPAKGWISPFFADQITGRLGLEIATFLRWQGLVEIALGGMMIVGVITPVVAILMALMFWSFTVANPVVGEIRLSRDLALAGLCVSVALAGAGRWSVDGWLRGASSRFAARRDATLTLVRLSLAYTLVASALFADGVFGNHLTSTLPTWLVFGLGVLPRRLLRPARQGQAAGEATPPQRGHPRQELPSAVELLRPPGFPAGAAGAHREQEGRRLQHHLLTSAS